MTDTILMRWIYLLHADDGIACRRAMFDQSRGRGADLDGVLGLPATLSVGFARQMRQLARHRRQTCFFDRRGLARQPFSARSGPDFRDAIYR
jgi:hypothetical protein